MPAAMSRTRSPGFAAQRGDGRPAPQPVLPEREDVVGEVVARGHPVEHPRDVGRVLVEGGAVHGGNCGAAAVTSRLAVSPRRRRRVIRDVDAPRDRRGCPSRTQRVAARRPHPRHPGPGSAARAAADTGDGWSWSRGSGTARAWSAGVAPRRGGVGSRPVRAGRRLVARGRGARGGPRRGAASRVPGRWSSARCRSPTTPPSRACMVVPEVVVGRRGDRWWVTTIGHDAHLPPIPLLRPSAPADAPARREVHRRRAARPTTGRAPSSQRGRADQRAATSTRSSSPATCRSRGRGADRRAMAAGPARRPVRAHVDVRRRRPGRRHTGAAGPPRPGPGPLAGARRHDPAHRRRRARPRARRVARPVQQGPRGARVCGSLGRRRARAALLLDERARDAVRPAPQQRHAPRDRRRRGRRRPRDVAGPRRVAAPDRGGRWDAGRRWRSR